MKKMGKKNKPYINNFSERLIVGIYAVDGAGRGQALFGGDIAICVEEGGSAPP